jgi:hypothetical protein
MIEPLPDILDAAKRNLRQHLLHRRPRLFDEGGQLVVHKIRLAVGPVLLLLGDDADDLRAHRPGSTHRPDFPHDARFVVDRRLGHHRVHHSAGALEGRAAWRVLPHAGSAQAFLVLLVPLFARLLVLVDALEKIGRNLRHHVFREGLGEIGEEAALNVGGLVRLADGNDEAAVLRGLDRDIVVIRLQRQILVALLGRGEELGTAGRGNLGVGVIGHRGRPLQLP